MKKVLFILFISLFMLINLNAADIAPYAKSAILVEESTGKVLFEKDIHEKRSPASMTKIMTLLLTMEALDSGKITLQDEVMISNNASSMGGTQIYAEANTKVSVENLIKGMAVASANDAATAISEYIGGTTSNFVEMMNKKAKELGCKNTNFKNPHGLDETDHYTTAYDLSLIARELIKHEQILNYTSIYEDYINVSGKQHWLVNTNKLVKLYDGIDGLKTGYTDNAKYCLTATMKKNDMRLVSIVMGEDTKEHRTTDTVSLLEYGYSMYGTNKIFDKNDYSGLMYIGNSSKREVKYYLNEDVKLVLDRDRKDVEYKTDVKLFDVKAPLKANSKVGELILNIDNEEHIYDLIVKEDIKKANYFEVLTNLLKDVINGKINVIFEK